MNYRHAMRINHPAFDFGHSGITFEVSPDESVWFSVERFVEESEYITLETVECTDGPATGFRIADVATGSGGMVSGEFTGI